MSKELKKEVKKNSELFYSSLNVQSSDAALFINGMHYDMDYTDIFTILDAIRQEERVLGGLGRSEETKEKFGSRNKSVLKRLDQGHLHPKLEVPGLTCRVADPHSFLPDPDPAF